MSINPAKRFGLDLEIKDGGGANLAVFDLDNPYTVNSEEFVSKGKSTPFNGYEVYGKCLLNIHQGKIVYQNEKFTK